MKDSDLGKLLLISHSSWEGDEDTQRKALIEIGRRAMFEREEEAYEAFNNSENLRSKVFSAFHVNLTHIRNRLTSAHDDYIEKVKAQLDEMLSDEMLEIVLSMDEEIKEIRKNHKEIDSMINDIKQSLSDLTDLNNDVE